MNFRPILVRFDQEIARSVTGNAHSPPETHFSRFFPFPSPLLAELSQTFGNNDKFYFKFIYESFIARLLFNFLIAYPFFLLSILIAFLGNGTLKVCYLNCFCSLFF